jgi:hypothetical protein
MNREGKDKEVETFKRSDIPNRQKRSKYRGLVNHKNKTK